MREILFKAKRKDNGEWIEGSLLKVNINDVIYYLIFGEEFSFLNDEVKSLSHCVVDPETVCQDTDLIDDDDISIWENDIVKITIYDWHTGKVLSETISPVIYSMGKFGVMHGSLRKFCGFDEFSMYTTFKVIGNVFDNPELLEVTP